MASAHDVEFSALLEALSDVVLQKEAGIQKVKIVNQILASIRASNNCSAPIYRLPAEILVDVFTYACTRPRARAESMPDHAALIAITHVCRRWRAVALGSATLWSHISLDQKSAVTFAKRSEPALLTVTVSVRGSKWNRKMGLLRCLLPRIQGLHVKVTWIKDLQKLADTLSSQDITSLTLQVNIKRDSGRHSLPHSPRAPPMFGGISTGLRSLTIVTEDYWRIPFGHFPRLTSLRLVHNGFTSLNSTSFNHLLSFLSHTPNLEDLEMRSTMIPFVEMRDPLSTASEPVCLPRLCQLRLVMGDAFALYSKLSMRKDAMVTLVGVSSNLPKRDPYLQPGAFKAVELLYYDRCAIFRARNAYRYLELCLSSRDAWSALRNHRYLSAVETLSLTVSSRIFTDDRIGSDLLAVIAHAPLLKALYIRDVNRTAIPHLVRMLTQKKPAPAPCPQLRTLTLSLVSPLGCLADLKPLLRATEERARRGAPLESVTICSPWHRTLNPSNVLSNLGGMHGLQWLLLCDRDLYRPFDSDAYGYGDDRDGAPGRLAPAGTGVEPSFREQTVRKFRCRWAQRENEGIDSDEGDVVDA